MPNFAKRGVWAMVMAATIAIASSVQAQTAGDPNAAAAAAAAAMAACNVDETTTSAVQKAAIFWGESYNASGDSLKAIALQHAGRALTDPQDKNMANQSGKAWEVGRIGMSWLELENQPLITTRGQLGFLGGDASQKVDLTVLVDSSFSIVEKQLPKCVPIVTMYREESGWVRLIQQALDESADAGNLPPTDTAQIRLTYDTALTTIQQAARVSKRSPYIGIVQAQIDQWKNDTKGAITEYRDGIEQTRRDTVYDPVRREIYQELGKAALDAGYAAKDSATKTYFLEVAKESFTALSKEPGTSGGKIAADGLMKVAILTGDTVSIKAAYLATLNNPDASYQDLIATGYAADHAASAGLKDAPFDEMKLFRRAGDLNPWGRDWLYNLSIVLAKADSGLSARPLIDRLMIVDPGCVDNYQAAAGVYALVERAAVAKANYYAEVANAATKPSETLKNKVYGDSAKIWDDSAAFFATKSTDFLLKKDSVNVGVEVTGFAPTDTGVVMTGTLTNRSDTPKAGTMRVAFLDHDGNTVATAGVPIVLDAKGTKDATKDFSATAKGAGLLAFKYIIQY